MRANPGPCLNMAKKKKAGAFAPASLDAGTHPVKYKLDTVNYTTFSFFCHIAHSCEKFAPVRVWCPLRAIFRAMLWLRRLTVLSLMLSRMDV